MITIYNLKMDKRWIELVQNASLHRDDCGLTTEPTLFGTPEWWSFVGTEKLPVHTIEGVITRVFISGHNDFPEFEVDDGTEKTHWERRGEDSAFTVGRRIRIRYVEMAFKRPVRGLGKRSKDVLTIEVDESIGTANQAVVGTSLRAAPHR